MLEVSLEDFTVTVAKVHLVCFKGGGGFSVLSSPPCSFQAQTSQLLRWQGTVTFEFSSFTLGDFRISNWSIPVLFTNLWMFGISSMYYNTTPPSEFIVTVQHHLLVLGRHHLLSLRKQHLKLSLEVVLLVIPKKIWACYPHR